MMHYTTDFLSIPIASKIVPCTIVLSFPFFSHSLCSFEKILSAGTEDATIPKYLTA